MNGMNALHGRWEILYDYIWRKKGVRQDFGQEIGKVRRDVGKTEDLVQSLAAQIDCLIMMVDGLREFRTAVLLNDRSKMLKSISEQQAIFAQSIAEAQRELNGTETELASPEFAAILKLQVKRARRIAKQLLVESEMERRPNDPRINDLREARDSYRAEALAIEERLYGNDCFMRTTTHVLNRNVLASKIELMTGCLSEFVKFANDVQQNSAALQVKVARLFTNFDERCHQTKQMHRALQGDLQLGHEQLELNDLAVKICDGISRMKGCYGKIGPQQGEMNKWLSATQILETFVEKHKSQPRIDRLFLV